MYAGECGIKSRNVHEKTFDTTSAIATIHPEDFGHVKYVPVKNPNCATIEADRVPATS